MPEDTMERRRARRVTLHAPLLIRRSGDGEAKAEERVVGDISLAGVYFETEKPDYAVDETLLASVSVPESQRRDFPFTRLAGRTRVVRVNELAPQGKDGRKRFGVALQFGADVTALATSPIRM